MSKRVSELAAAASLAGSELLLVSRLSQTVSITGVTLSFLEGDQSINDFGDGLVAAGFAVGQQVRILGPSNDHLSAAVTSVTAGKMVVAVAGGGSIVTAPSGSTVTVTAWESVRATVDQVNGATRGREIFAVPDGLQLDASATATPTNSSHAVPVRLTAPMLLSALEMVVTASASGTVKWGLYDFSAAPSAAVRVAEGSAALNATGVRQIAATGGPVELPAGVYMLIVTFPASNCPTVRRCVVGGGVAAAPAHKYSTTFGAGATANLTAGWTLDSALTWMVLRGALGAGAAW